MRSNPGAGAGAAAARAARRDLTIASGLLLALSALAPEASGYYHDTAGATNCFTCHRDFRSAPYVSLRDGSSWGSSLHDVHRSVMLGGDCLACHTGATTVPVYTGRSTGGTGLDPISCSGCHGRLQDGWGTSGTMGYSAGLRLRHWIADRIVNGVSTRDCRRCHPDSDPNTVPASEWVSPPYYARPGSGHPGIPAEPCNLPPSHGENQRGDLRGLDNDGDGLFDAADPDCAPGPATPGEASSRWLPPLRVTGYDRITGRISIAFDPPCGAATHDVHFGPLDQVASYGWSGSACEVGAGGAAAFDLGPGSYFFVVVGADGPAEGSYGRGRRPDRSVYERPPAPAGACGRARDLSHRCD